jgi:hypothetical protein
VVPEVVPPPQETNIHARTATAAIASSLRLLVKSKPATDAKPIHAQSNEAGNAVLGNGGDGRAATVGAVVATVTATATDEDPSRVTEDLENVHVASDGAPVQAN